MNRLRRGAHDGSPPDEGASAVEFAIIAPLLFMLIFGIIQFGIFFAQDLAISNAARQAARTAAVPATGDCQSIADAVDQGAIAIALDRDNDALFDFDVFVPSSSLDMCPPASYTPPIPSPPVRPCEGQPDGTEIQVVVTYDASLAIPLVDDFGTISLEREGNYRCEFK